MYNIDGNTISTSEKLPVKLCRYHLDVYHIKGFCPGCHGFHEDSRILFLGQKHCTSYACENLCTINNTKLQTIKRTKKNLNSCTISLWCSSRKKYSLLHYQSPIFWFKKIFSLENYLPDIKFSEVNE